MRSFDDVAATYPSVLMGEREWVQAFNDRPHVLDDLLRVIGGVPLKTLHAERQKHRTFLEGQPMTQNVTRRLAGAGPADYLAAVRAGDLFIDPSYQRDLDERRLHRMAVEYDPRLIGVLEVAARDDDRYAVIDGQHRWHLIKEMDAAGDDALVIVRVHLGLEPEDEARLFHEFGVRRKALTAMDKWKARRASADPTVVAIEKITAQLGWKVADRSGESNLKCVSMLERIFTRYGPSVLEDALLVIDAAWNGDVDSAKAMVVGGVADVIANYPTDVLDQSRLTDALRTTTPLQLIARCQDIGRAGTGYWSYGMATVVVQIYNRRAEAPDKIPNFAVKKESSPAKKEAA